MDTTSLLHALRASIPDIMARWQVTVDSEPGLAGAATLDVDSLPELLDTALTLLGDPTGAPAERRHLVAWGVKHGRDRILQGVPDELIFKEFYVLRRAVWDVLRDLEGCAEAASRIITHVDGVLAVASRASLRGYYHEHFEAGGKDVVDGLVEEGPWPPALTGAAGMTA